MSLSRAASIVGEAAGAEAQRADQRAVHDEVGVAPDRRGEVRVAPQVEAEVAEVLGGVDGLRLRAQHHLVDEVRDGQRLGPLQDAVEVAGAQRSEPRQLQVQAVQELAQRQQLLLRGRVVHAVDDRRALGFQRLGGGDVGLDHELLDQAMRRQPLRRHHALDAALRVEQDLALGQVEVERLAPIAGSRERARRPPTAA